MRLIFWEWKKLFSLPALWGFLALGFLLNLGFIFGQSENQRSIFNGISACTAQLGQRVDADFMERLENLPADPNRELIWATAEGMEDIFETYDTDDLKTFYQSVMESSTLAASWAGWKYDLLSKRVEQLAQKDAAMDFYAGPVTQEVHQFLFGTLIRSILAQAAVAAMLGTLYLMGYERIHRTAGTLYTTHTGRKILGIKVGAALLAVPVLFSLAALPALAVYFLRMDYRGIWQASVSSQFNYLTDLLFSRPFITWGDFTVGQYLGAVLVLGISLTAGFAFLAALCGALCPNPYLAALALGGFCAGGLMVVSWLGEMHLWVAYDLALFQLPVVWLCSNAWFTELGSSAVLPWQETVTVILNLLVLGAGTAGALKRFSRKDVAA